MTVPRARSTDAPAPWVIVAGILLLCLVWGSTWLVIREGLTALPPLTSAAVRFALAGAVMVLIAPRLASFEGGARPGRKLTVVYGVLTLSLPYAFIYEAETVLPSGLVSVLWSVYPLFLAACAHFALPKERLHGRQWLGLVVGFLGVVVLFATEVREFGPEALPAALLLVSSPVFTAVGNTLIKRDGAGTSSALLNRDGTLLGAVLLAAAALVLEHDRESTWSPAAIGSVLYLALVGSVLAFSVYYWLLRYAPATRMSLLVYGVPVVAVTLGVTVAGETAGRNTLMGMAGILLGVFLVLKKERAKNA